MRYDFMIASMLIALAACLAVGAAFIFSRKERLLGLKLLGLFGIVNAVYSFSYAFYMLSDRVGAMLSYMHILFFALAFLMPTWYFISVQQRYELKSFNWKKAHLFFIVPVIACVAMLLYPFREIADPSWFRTLFFTDHDVATIAGSNWEGFIGMKFAKGVLYYVLAGYSLLLAGAAAFNFFTLIRQREGIAKKRARFLFFNAMIAIVLIALTFVSPETMLIDFSAFFTNWIAFAAFLSLYKYELFDLIPLAYAEIFRKSDYPIVILDETKNVVTLNAAAERVFEASTKHHQRLDLALLHHDEGVLAREVEAGREYEIAVAVEGKTKYFRASASTLGRSKKKPTGYFVTYLDVTDHKEEMRRMEQMAAYDELTKIYNRRYFFRKATEAFDEAVANRQNVRLVMFDLDGFKDINDIYGHQAGDAILAQLAKLVSAALRTTDIFARYGGEEFIIFQKNINEGEARAIDQKVCDAIANHAFLYQRRTIKVTGSFGVAGSQAAVNKPLERYIKEADDAMYVSKTAGKNQVSYSTDLK